MSLSCCQIVGVNVFLNNHTGDPFSHTAGFELDMLQKADLSLTVWPQEYIEPLNGQPVFKKETGYFQWWADEFCPGDMVGYNLSSRCVIY